MLQRLIDIGFKTIHNSDSKLLLSEITEGQEVACQYLHQQTKEIVQIQGYIKTKYSRNRYLLETEDEIYLLDRYESRENPREYAVVRNPYKFIFPENDSDSQVASHTKVGTVLEII